MAAAITVTSLFDWKSPPSGKVNVFTIDWTSASDGTVDLPLVDSAGNTIGFNGVLLNASFFPDTGGTQPANAYDLTITNDLDIDVLGGLGSNLANNANTQDCPLTATNSMPFVVEGPLQLVIANAGDSKGGIVKLSIR